MKSKQKKQPRKRTERNKLYCMDCGEPLSPELMAETRMMRKSLDMPNMLIFCDGCRHKFKNRLRRIWNGIKYLFE